MDKLTLILILILEALKGLAYVHSIQQLLLCYSLKLMLFLIKLFWMSGLVGWLVARSAGYKAISASGRLELEL